MRDGKVVIERLETLDGGKQIEVPDGLIHHWIGTVFIPGATLAQTLAFEQDYDHQQQYFRPDVVRSKILKHDGNDFVIELRFYKKKVITTVLDTTHEVHYQPVDATHEWSRSRTTRVQEVDDAGKPDEKLEPEGHDRGFLWRMNTYWRFEEKDGGTYAECQSISLTRDIPTGLGWMIGPYVNSVPRESLTFTLERTRSAILQRIGANHRARKISAAQNAKLKRRRSQERVRHSVRIARHQIVRKRKEAHRMPVAADRRRQAASVQRWRQSAGRLAGDDRSHSAVGGDIDARVADEHVFDSVRRICAQIRRRGSKSNKLPRRVERRRFRERVRRRSSVARGNEDRRRRATRLNGSNTCPGCRFPALRPN